MTRRVFKIAIALSLLIAVLAAAVLVRGLFVSDVVKIYTYDPAARRYTEWHGVSQGGMLMLHHRRTTIDPTDDPAVAHDRAGPTGRKVWHYRPPGGVHSAGPWLWWNRYRTSNEGVANPNGLTDCFTLELRTAGLLIAGLPWPMAWAVWRWRANRRRRQLSGHVCLACGYDLRASPNRCPECGTTTPAIVASD